MIKKSFILLIVVLFGVFFVNGLSDENDYKKALNDFKGTDTTPNDLFDIFDYELRYFGEIDSDTIKEHFSLINDILEKSSVAEIKIMSNILIAEYYLKLMDGANGLKYSEAAYKMAEKVTNESLIADSLATMGSSYYRLYKYDEVYNYCSRALKYKSLNIYRKINAFFNMYLYYEFVGQLNTGLHFLLSQKDFFDGLSGKIDSTYTDMYNYYIGYAYQNIGQDDKAIEIMNNILPGLKQNDIDFFFQPYIVLGISYTNQGKHEKTAEIYEKIYKIAINKKIIHQIINIGASLIETYSELKELEKARHIMDFLLTDYVVYEEQQVYYFDYCYNNIGKLYRVSDDQDTAIKYQFKALELANSIDDGFVVKRCYDELYKCYLAKNDYKQALDYFTKFVELKEKDLNLNITNQIAELNVQYESSEKEKRILELNHQNKLANQRNLMMLIVTLISLVGIVIFAILSFMIQKKNVQIAKQNKIIADERDKSDKLLLNILPHKVADELKNEGVSEPELFSNVSVFFSDIVGFTNMSSKMEPKELIMELNDIFTTFDHIMEKNNCERIKTIGDAYMAVCGMPQENPDHAENIVKAALKCISFIKNKNLKSKIQWGVRIGVHSGPVVGGIVGVKKYIYDVFGDTVNTASRMESNSESLRLNISNATYELIKDKFKCIKRETLFVKGKGEMEMYFVEGMYKDKESGSNPE